MDLIQMSVQGSIMVFMILLVRTFFLNNLPKKTFLLLWKVTLLRLLLPFSVPFKGSFYTVLLQGMKRINGEKPFISGSSLDFIFFPDRIADEVFSAPFQTASKVSVWKVIWLIGTLICLVFFFVTYVRCYREFRTSLPVSNASAQKWLKNHPQRRKLQLRQSDRIQAPLTYGLIHPVILTPKGVDWENETSLMYILEHEFVHIQRFDILLKLVMITALCLHWFNPIIWLMYIVVNRDIELVCDESVLRRFGEDTKSAYALALINMEEQKNRFMPLCSNFRKNAIEERIRSIMKIRKLSVLTGTIGILLVVGITSVFATSAKSEDAVVSETNETALMKLLENYGDYETNLQFQVFNENGSILYSFSHPVSYIREKASGFVQWGNGRKTKEKLVKKTYPSEDEIPSELSYQEYMEEAWWGGLLQLEDITPLKGSRLYEATFSGILYEAK